LNAELEAILWDMDGVLADTERDGHRPAFNRAFKESELNTEWDPERYGKLLETGGGKERMTAHWNEVGWPEAISEEGRQEKVKELHLRKTDIFMDMINEGNIPLRPGVLRIIDEAIAADIRLAVCSTSNVNAVTNLVQTLMGPERAARFMIFAGDSKCPRWSSVVLSVHLQPGINTCSYISLLFVLRCYSSGREKETGSRRV
jgi:phosphoglycolate phosphatase-like HAD superfamily hydrolase